MSPLAIVWIGTSETAEFAGAAEMVSRRANVYRFASAAAAIEALPRTAVAPALLVLAQQRPGEIGALQVDALRRLYPVAPLVGLLGSWCEGEGRSGKPWPGVARVYWHQAATRLASAIDSLASGRKCRWLQSATDSDEERLLSTDLSRGAARLGSVAIHADTFDGMSWLVDACGRLGFAVLGWSADQRISVHGADAVIWNLEYPGAHDELILRRLRERLPQTPTLLLLDFPRAETIDRWRSAGIEAIASKPILLDELAHYLRQLIAAPTSHRTAA